MASVNAKAAITLICLGLILVAVSIPLLPGKIEINRGHGFRIRKAFESAENLCAINSYGAKKSGEYEYLQIVESIRGGDKVRQKVIGTLGRADKVLASGKIDALIRSLAQFAHHLKVVEASRTPDMQAVSSREWGPALVFGSLWDKQGMPDLLRCLAQSRRIEFDVERASFAMALQRLCAPGSDLAGSQWISGVECPGFDKLELQHFYRTTSFLAEVRDELEAELSWRDRAITWDLF